MIRLCYALDYSGYSELQNELRRTLLDWSPQEQAISQLRQAADQLQAKEDLISFHMEQDLATISQTLGELGSCGILNIKIGRVGGLTESKRIHDLCQSRGIPVWCGGMVESGIGRAHNVAVTSLPNFTIPGDTAASSWRLRAKSPYRMDPASDTPSTSRQ